MRSLSNITLRPVYVEIDSPFLPFPQSLGFWNHALAGPESVAGRPSCWWTVFGSGALKEGGLSVACIAWAGIASCTTRNWRLLALHGWQGPLQRIEEFSGKSAPRRGRCTNALPLDDFTPCLSISPPFLLRWAGNSPSCSNAVGQTLDLRHLHYLSRGGLEL